MKTPNRVFNANLVHQSGRDFCMMVISGLCNAAEGTFLKPIDLMEDGA